MLKQLIFTLLLLSTGNLIAQEGTTLEEYRYLSKGYVYQLEMGLDAQKEGYLIKNIFNTSNGADLVGLYQIGNSEPRALLVILDKGKEKVNYFCLPNGKSDQRVLDLAGSDKKNISTDLQKEYQVAINEFLFAALSNPDIKTLTYSSRNNIPASYKKDETLVSRSANLDNFIKKAPKAKMAKPEKSDERLVASTSTYHGDIVNRSVVQAEEALSSSNKKGIISIKICVDMDGNVISSKFTQRGSTTFDAYLKKVSLEAAKNIKFAKNDLAEQCGIVSYKF